MGAVPSEITRNKMQKIMNNETINIKMDTKGELNIKMDTKGERGNNLSSLANARAQKNQQT